MKRMIWGLTGLTTWNLIVIEDRFADVIITDKDVDQIEVVGDLIRYIETADNERRRRPSPRRRRSSDPEVRAAFSSRAVEPAERQDRCEQVVMRTRPGTYVEGAGLLHARTFRA
jgi:hypothetical protein